MTSKLKCPFCQTELEQMYDKKMLGCPKCLHIADGAFWGIVIETQRHLKLLEPIVASLQGRADINAEEARDSNELVAQWYEKYEQSQKDLDTARKALKQIVCADKDGKPLKGVVSCWLDMDELNKCIEQIEHKE